MVYITGREFVSYPLIRIRSVPKNRSVDELIAAARRDESQMNQLLERYKAYLLLKARLDHRLKTVQRKVGGSDVAQITLTKAFHGFEKFRGEDEPQFTGWLMAIYENTVATINRTYGAEKRDINREVLESALSGSACLQLNGIPGRVTSPPSDLIRGESALELADAINSLPEAQREAVQKRHFEQMKIAEIAASMDRSVEAVAGLLRRALQQLRRELS